MKKAVVVFVEDKRSLLMQFGWLYTSIKHIGATDTDLIVFGTKSALDKLPQDCIKIECPPVEGPDELKNYNYLNSIHIFLRPEINILKNYDWVLRTDVDTFLTPAWNQYHPSKYTVGHGGYVNTENVKQNLKRVAEKFDLQHRGIFNIGSTHYGPPKKLIQVHKHAFTIVMYLLTEEFKDFHGEWPDWYSGVSLLYGCDIAMNHYIEDFTIDRKNFDYFSTSKNSVHDHAHIHCWHTDEVFSKFMMEAGKYDDVKLDDLNTEQINEYCLYIALKAKDYSVI